MNVQTYENCIKSLENEIKSRQQQRQSMQNTIMALDRDMGIEIQKNKSMRGEIMYLAQNNQNIINQMHRLEQIVRDKDAIIQEKIAADEGRRLYIESLQKDKAVLSQQLRQKDVVIGRNNLELGKKENDLKVALQSIKGLESLMQRKGVQISQLSKKLHTYQDQLRTNEEKCASLNLNIVKMQKQQQKQRKQYVQKLLKTECSASTIVSELQLRIKQLQKELQQKKQFYKDQVSTLQFNKQSQEAQLTKTIFSLQKRITSQDQQIRQLKQQQNKLKSQYEEQIDNNQKVINTLMNEINFLKEEKVDIKKRSSQRIEETAQQFLMMELDKADMEVKAKAAETQINSLKAQISQLNKTAQAQINSLKGQISQLKGLIDKLRQSAQLADQEKQSLAKKIAKQINSLKHQNQQLSKRLQLSTAQLQQLKITSCQLQQNLKFMGMQKHSTSSSVAQLQSLIKTHQFTIQKLQHMLSQANKVVQDLNNLMKTKLAEVESLEISNNLFRREKLDWISREDQYRKKICDYKTVVSAAKKLNLNQMSLVPRTKRSMAEKETHNNNRQRTHSMVVQNSHNKDSPQPLSTHIHKPIRRNTMIPANFSQQRTNFLNHNNNHQFYGSMGQFGNQFNKNIIAIPLAQNAFKKPQTIRDKKKSVDFTQMPIQAPEIPVLIAMKKSDNKMNLQCEGVNWLHKQQTGDQERVCWEGLSQNMIQALAQDTFPRDSLSDRQSLINKERRVDQNQQLLRNIPPFQQQQSPIQPQSKPLTQGFQLSEKQISAQTQPQKRPLKDNLQKIIQVKYENFSPKFYFESDEPDPIYMSCLNKNQNFDEKENLDEENQMFQGCQDELRRMSISRKISPINSRVLTRQDRLVQIFQHVELTQLSEHNFRNQVNGLNSRDQSLSHMKSGPFCKNQPDEQDSVEVQKTVDSIKLLLDRINTQ